MYNLVHVPISSSVSMSDSRDVRLSIDKIGEKDGAEIDESDWLSSSELSVAQWTRAPCGNCS